MQGMLLGRQEGSSPPMNTPRARGIILGPEEYSSALGKTPRTRGSPETVEQHLARRGNNTLVCPLGFLPRQNGQTLGRRLKPAPTFLEKLLWQQFGPA
jgi:hypothetical protein